MIVSYCITCACACGVTGPDTRTVFVLLAGLECECLVSDASVYYRTVVTSVKHDCMCLWRKMALYSFDVCLLVGSEWDCLVCFTLLL